ncbi:MAG TPA: hypothetical protein VM097_01265 [Mycobacteriales bacterium]|nr:hypothetical protein [Mycobacteriales bacterium]
MNDATTIPPMPETTCPRWCTRDHAADWARSTQDIGRDYAIPMADGTVSHGTITVEGVLRLWEPWHTRTLLESERYDLIVVDEDGPALMLGDEVVTAAQVRDLARALLEAVEAFEAL